ncbi:hypothetical protein AAC387_Pa06g1675 [Persea americana]
MCCLLVLLGRSQAQTTTNATTDPSEVRAINSIFGQWGVSVSSSAWNISGEPCSGKAVDSTTLDNFNPAIKCDCSFNSSTTCHITQLKVQGLQATGVITEEIGSLPFLTNLILDQNYLTGPLPAFIGNLTSLQYLSVSINALSGNIPKELGKLQNLLSLSFSSNSFSGSLPPELGNLTKLEQIYIDSAGMSGEIPPTFAKLRNLKIVWASDNNISGKLPDFIGNNWTNITILSLQGNSFEGPIPSSFGNLISLTNLRLSDVSNGSSTLDFIKNMTSLSTLVMRNNMLSGSIPSSIGDYSALQLLDLSFNNLTGKLPASLFNMTSLSYLFLGSNSLSGTLPLNKRSLLTAIDLSYNQLSGTFPSWVREQGLQLNLVANNYIFDSSNNSVLPSGLDCLQRNFPCGRGSPIYSDFAINCGGDTLRTSDANYERDNETLGVASYYVTSANNWAVSSVGRYLEGTNDAYTRFTQQTFSNALNLQLFQSIRLSPVSLRYYGLGLENGNYTVNLQFADIDFPDSATWQSVGRRVFDIYIQGSLQVKDFDIKKAAGGVTLKAVGEILTARVSDNYLEIHLLWAGKGTCCIPSPGTYGPAISAIKVTPDFIPSVRPPATSTKNKKIGLIVGISVSIGVVGVLSIFVFIWRKRSKMRSNDEDEDFLGMDSRPNTFGYGELKTATEGFSPANKLGEGGFGPVYKGTLPDGRIVAVKQLSVASHQGKNQFVAEIATISAVQQRNLVKLYGCCIEGDERLLVYEYLENKSLDQALFGKSNLHLNWATRFDICLGTARGLAYLHEESRPRIVHRDVKASNILLDADLNPKISDFGLAKLYDDKLTHISTRVAGTIGYLAPEYAMRGHLTEKADVFAFGVVTLEILSGRPNSSLNEDPEKMYLLEWAWHLYENNRALELVDPALSEFNEGQATQMIGVALLCIQASPMLRPPMSRVIAMLLGDIEVSTVTTRPGYLTDLPFRDTSSFMTDSTSGASTSINTNRQLTSSSNASTVTHIESSPTNSAGPLLEEIVGNGR